MYKLIKSKKAWLDDGGPLMLTFFVFAFAIVGFLVLDLGKSSYAEEYNLGLTTIIEDTDNLLIFIQENSDLIIDSVTNDDYVILEKELNLFFNPIYSQDLDSWEIYIGEKNIKGFNYDDQYGTKLITKTTLPSYNNAIIEIRFFRQSQELENIKF